MSLMVNHTRCHKVVVFHTDLHWLWLDRILVLHAIVWTEQVSMNLPCFWRKSMNLPQLPAGSIRTTSMSNTGSSSVQASKARHMHGYDGILFTMKRATFHIQVLHQPGHMREMQMLSTRGVERGPVRLECACEITHCSERVKILYSLLKLAELHADQPAALEASVQSWDGCFDVMAQKSLLRSWSDPSSFERSSWWIYSLSTVVDFSYSHDGQ